MARQLKRWESPRKEGRNDKGKGGAARKRQIEKRNRMIRQKLKSQKINGSSNQSGGREVKLFPLIFMIQRRLSLQSLISSS